MHLYVFHGCVELLILNIFGKRHIVDSYRKKLSFFLFYFGSLLLTTNIFLLNLFYFENPNQMLRDDVIEADLAVCASLSLIHTHAAVAGRCHHAGGICAVCLSVGISQRSHTLSTVDCGDHTVSTAVEEPIYETQGIIS